MKPCWWGRCAGRPGLHFQFWGQSPVQPGVTMPWANPGDDFEPLATPDISWVLLGSALNPRSVRPLSTTRAHPQSRRLTSWFNFALLLSRSVSLGCSALFFFFFFFEGSGLGRELGSRTYLCCFLFFFGEIHITPLTTLKYGQFSGI